MRGLLTAPPDVIERLGVTVEPGGLHWLRIERACRYVSSVLRARFPLLPSEVSDEVRAVATEVTVRYLGGDPAMGGFISETIGAYRYQRGELMGTTRLTDDEMTVFGPYGGGALRSLQLSAFGGEVCRCGWQFDDVECFAVGHERTQPLNDEVPMP